MFSFSNSLGNTTRPKDGVKLPNLTAMNGSTGRPTEGTHLCEWWVWEVLEHLWSTVLLQHSQYHPEDVWDTISRYHAEKTAYVAAQRERPNSCPESFLIIFLAFRKPLAILQNRHIAAASNSPGKQPLLVENTSNGNWSETLVFVTDFLLRKLLSFMPHQGVDLQRFSRFVPAASADSSSTGRFQSHGLNTH